MPRLQLAAFYRVALKQLDKIRARRIEYLDRQWWPHALSQVSRQHSQLVTSHGPTFIERWERAVNKPPPEPGGFDVE